MFGLFSKKVARPSAPLLLTNTLSRKKEHFSPQKKGAVSLYSCGPTVYSRAHIGNLRAYVFSDVLARTLAVAGYHVRRVINITDVGHLVSDGDEGEDKMEVGARREGLSAEDIASRYTGMFLKDIEELNVDNESIVFPRATAYIKEQIAMIEVLEKKGHTYRITDGMYFDTSTFMGYGKLGGVPEEYIHDGSAQTLPERAELSMKGRIAENSQKRHPADFALWKFSPKGEKRLQEWESPWGRGFPGWHIECSAMAKALLGVEIDIHTGGIDHIPIHHNNEIAQSESANGRPFVRYWMHSAFLSLGEKISKSLGNVVYLSDITDKGLDPLSLRYLFLQAHYRSPLAFSWDALAAADEALGRLRRACALIQKESKGVSVSSDTRNKLIAILQDDLQTPQALALLWETVRSDELSAKVQWGVIEAAEKVLALSLTDSPALLSMNEVPPDVQELLREREDARKARDFAKADQIRIHIETRGYLVEDTASGPLLSKKRK